MPRVRKPATPGAADKPAPRPRAKSRAAPVAQPPRAARGKIDGKPDPIDVHVGARMRLRRAMLGVTQAELASLLGLTFQQIQKYERGVNRVSASTLWRAAEALEVPVAYFFEDLAESDDGADPFDPKTLLLAGTLERLAPDVRHAVGALVTALGRGAAR